MELYLDEDEEGAEFVIVGFGILAHGTRASS